MKRVAPFVSVAAFVLLTSVLTSEVTPAQAPAVAVERLDPALDALITARRDLYRLRVTVGGRSPGPAGP